LSVAVNLVYKENYNNGIELCSYKYSIGSMLNNLHRSILWNKLGS